MANSLPSTIQKAVGQPPICDLEKVVGRNQIVRYVEFELVKMTALISVGNNLNDSQVQFIATQLVEFFPNESIADFKICFQRGCIGQYGEIYRMDGIVLRHWMEKYLEEKYTVVESNWTKQKDDEKKPVDAVEGRDWLKAWKESIDKLPHAKVLSLTQDQIEKEGKEKPPATDYNPSPVEQIEMINRHKAKIRESRRKYYLDAFPDATDEEVQAYIEKFDTI